MKIGIISMQRICNYGSYLQAYGLKKMIEALGHEVVFVDYKAEKPLIRTTKDNIKYLVDKCKKNAIEVASSSALLASVLPKGYKAAAQMHLCYRSKYWRALGLEKVKQYHTKVDILVIGSDEVFNCLQKNPDVGYSTELFGNRAHAGKIITYAASFGNVTYDALQEAGVLGEITGFISKYTAISVRDKNSYEIIKKLLPDREIIENLDPVLMYDYGKRKKKPVDISNYIVVYAYRGRLNEDEIKAIKSFATKEKKQIICIGGYHSFADRYIQTSPFHVLDYFENADYVITDTFHGTIFSIISHTKFGVLVRQGHGLVYGNSEKLDDLLSRLLAKERVIGDLKQMSSVIKADFDFEMTDALIEKEREKAYEYLKSNL